MRSGYTASDHQNLTVTTWPTIFTTESDRKRLFRLSYRSIAPVNVTLCFLILLFNSLVVSHYFKNRTKITSVLFLLISISDIMTAVGNLFFAGGVVLWSSDTEAYDYVMWWFFVVYRVLGLFGYSCSIFLNTVLAVLRTIKVYDPFYRPRIVVLLVVGVVYAAILMGLTGFDLYTMFLSDPSFRNFLFLWYFISPFEEMYPFPGQTIGWTVFIADDFTKQASTATQFSILSVIYMIPISAVFISMMVQVHIGVQHSQTGRDEARMAITDWVHVNTTVFLLAAVFLTCNSALTLAAAMVLIVGNSIDLEALDSQQYRTVTGLIMKIQGPTTTILPLLNAVLTPLIIISRNRQLLRKIAVRMRNMLMCAASEGLIE